MKKRAAQSPANPDRPKAYLNFVLFDEGFTLVEGSSGVKQVSALPGELQTLAQDNVVMEKSGFLYVYTSNETQQDVFFDNVIVSLAGTPVLEETHYYPFRLTMAGISDKQSVEKVYNRFKFNGIEETNVKGFRNTTGMSAKEAKIFLAKKARIIGMTQWMLQEGYLIMGWGTRTGQCSIYKFTMKLEI